MISEVLISGVQSFAPTHGPDAEAKAAAAAAAAVAARRKAGSDAAAAAGGPLQPGNAPVPTVGSLPSYYRIAHSETQDD